MIYSNVIIIREEILHGGKIIALDTLEGLKNYFHLQKLSMLYYHYN